MYTSINKAAVPNDPILQYIIIGRDISFFMSWYRMHVKAAITPKMHLLEEHLVPWLRKWKLGMDKMAEHGAESIHSRINSLKHFYANIPNKEKQLKELVKAHHLQLCMSNKIN